MTKQHEEELTIHLHLFYPEHEPREQDPHYHVFNETRRRLKEQGLLRCAVGGCTNPGPIELHHDKVEFSLQNGIDIQKFNTLYGLHLNEEDFKNFIEGPGNLEPLCTQHHRGNLGIHFLPAPQWLAMRVWRDDLPSPATKE